MLTDLGGVIARDVAGSIRHKTPFGIASRSLRHSLSFNSSSSRALIQSAVSLPTSSWHLQCLVKLWRKLSWELLKNTWETMQSALIASTTQPIKASPTLVCKAGVKRAGVHTRWRRHEPIIWRKSLAGKAPEDLCSRVHLFDKTLEPSATSDAVQHPGIVLLLGRMLNLQEISTFLDPGGILKRHLKNGSNTRSSSWIPPTVGIYHTEQSSTFLHASWLQICSAHGFIHGFVISQFPDTSLKTGMAQFSRLSQILLSSLFSSTPEQRKYQLFKRNLNIRKRRS